MKRKINFLHRKVATLALFMFVLLSCEEEYVVDFSDGEMPQPLGLSGVNHRNTASDALVEIGGVSDELRDLLRLAAAVEPDANTSSSSYVPHLNNSLKNDPKYAHLNLPSFDRNDAHFSRDRWSESIAWINLNRLLAVEAVALGLGINRVSEVLGYAFHAIGDFYAHSNWIEHWMLRNHDGVKHYNPKPKQICLYDTPGPPVWFRSVRQSDSSIFSHNKMGKDCLETMNNYQFHIRTACTAHRVCGPASTDVRIFDVDNEFVMDEVLLAAKLATRWQFDLFVKEVLDYCGDQNNSCHGHVDKKLLDVGIMSPNLISLVTSI